MLSEINSDLFYGPPTIAQKRIETKICKTKKTENIFSINNSGLKNLLGPSRIWKVFKKQHNAIEFRSVKYKSSGLMCFAFEQSDGSRSFLVAHPIILWFVMNNRPTVKRCTYEVIEEVLPCKLYLDIEYEFKYNPLCIGKRMIETIITIIAKKLNILFNIECGRDFILELDATTEKKFSKHLIYQIPDVAFKNNYVTGNVIKEICREILDACSSEDAMNQMCVNYGLTSSVIKELQVTDRKGNSTLIIDSGVYTKNRHFRLLNCSKLNKNNPLVLSSENTYKSKQNSEYSLFLDSLITFFSSPPTQILTYGKETPNVIPSNNNNNNNGISIFNMNSNYNSETLETFLNDLVSPRGCIKKQAYQPTEKLVMYEVIGVRYCGNIGREHRRNHIKLVVNLEKGVYYQKCFDPDCRNYKSPEISLPASILFNLDNDFVFDENFTDVIDSILTNSSVIDSLFDDIPNTVVPDMGLCDSEMEDIANCVETLSCIL